MSLLEVRNLSKHFGNLMAVDDVSFAVEEGEIRGLIGPNGAGKTTMFSLISGFLQPTKGEVIWRGENLAGKPPNTMVRKGIARTFQLTTLFKELTALENVIMACHLHTGTRLWQQFLRTGAVRQREKEIEQKAIGLLEKTGIAEARDETAQNLPHGHQRILGIAIALATKPSLLLLDEPVTGMNPTETEATMEVVRRLRNEGITILLVEHDMKAVMSTCDKLTVMSFGKKIAEGLPEEVRKNQAVVEAYLGTGYTHA